MCTGINNRGFIQFDTSSFDKYNLLGVTLPSAQTSCLATGCIAAPSSGVSTTELAGQVPSAGDTAASPHPGGSPAPGRAPTYLEKRSHHVENYENQGERRVAALQGADGVKEDQVPRHHQKQEHASGARIHICKETQTELRLQVDSNTQDSAASPGDKVAQWWLKHKQGPAHRTLIPRRQI